MTYKSSPKYVFIFMGICVVGFLLQQITNQWGYLAFFPAFAREAPWMFVTSIFLHADLSHLFFNMFALFFFGIYLERMVGKKTFVMIFFLSGVFGNLGYMVTASDPFTPAIGASGSVYGLIGALAVLAPFMMIFVYGFLPMPMILAAILYGFMDFAGLFGSSGIAHGAHLGGMFVGVASGFYLRMRANRWRSKHDYT